MGIDHKAMGQRIKLRRKQCGLTQEQLAEKLEVTVGYVSQIERGITRANLDMLAQIAESLHCEISFLLCGTSTHQEDYLSPDISGRWKQLDPKQRRIVLDLIDSLMVNE